MADTLIKMKTGTIAKMEQKNGNNPVVPLDKGTVYFAVDTSEHIGKIVYDAPSGENGVDRIVMGTEAEYADYAGEAAKATGITGIYPVKGTQTAATASWTGVISGVNSLFDGLTIAYYLPYAGVSSTNVTLNLTFEDNTTTGAIPVYYTNASRATTHYGAGATIILTYWSAGSISVAGTATTEGRWLRADYDSTNIYQLRHNSGPYTTTTATGRYMLFLAHPTSGTSLIPVTAVNNSTATTKTLTSAKFNPFGPILYYSYNSTTAIAANANLTVSNLYEQVAFDLRYSFNTGTTLTTNKDVYIKATPQSDGSAILDTSTPITQTLPTSADGKIYIYLGHAYSTSSVELHPIHPVYYYKNGALALYTAEPVATTSTSGLMSASDKSRLDGMTDGATNTTITATAPINASASTGAVSLTHSTSGPSSSGNTSKGDTSNQTPGFGSTFKVTSETVDKYGHTTALAEHTVKIPDAAATTSVAGLMSATDKSKLDAIAENAKNTTITATAPINASASTGSVSLTHSTSGPSSTADTSKGDTSNQTPTWGGTFKVTSGTVDKYGHTKTFADHTVKIPNAVVTTSAAGLMSATDKSNFDSGISIAGNTVNIGGSLSAGTLKESLGLSNSMHFIGHATVAITDNSTTDPEILNYNFGVNGANAQAGDVIIDSDTSYEYVWSTLGRWERLGPDGSYALSDHTHTNATTSVAGFMSATDKAKLDGIAEGAETGTVTSVRVQATSPVVSSVNTAQSTSLNTTISLADAYGDTKNPYGSKTARYVLAAPASAAGVPSFRALTNADVGLGNVENTKLSTWTGSSNITTIGTLSAGTVPWARLSNVPTASTTGAGIIQIGSEATNAAAGNHTHTTSIATSSGTNQLTLAFGTKYAVTAGGTSYIFTMPSNPNTDINQNITLKTTTKGYITAVETAPTATAAAQAAIADTGVYLTTTAGQLNATSYKVADTALISYNTTTGCIEIIT